LPSATWRMSRTARCTGGAMYGPAPGIRFPFGFSGMDVRLLLDDLADDARDLRRLLLADRVSGVGNLEIRVALRSARQSLEGTAAIWGRRDAVLHADDDRGRHLELGRVIEQPADREEPRRLVVTGASHVSHRLLDRLYDVGARRRIGHQARRAGSGELRGPEPVEVLDSPRHRRG